MVCPGTISIVAVSLSVIVWVSWLLVVPSPLGSTPTFVRATPRLNPKVNASFGSTMVSFTIFNALLPSSSVSVSKKKFVAVTKFCAGRTKSWTWKSRILVAPAVPSTVKLTVRCATLAFVRSPFTTIAGPPVVISSERSVEEVANSICAGS